MLRIDDKQTYAIIGAAMAVHTSLGCGFLEAVYQEAMAIELAHRQIQFEREVDISVSYRGHVLACNYRADFICYNSIIVELKSIQAITNVEKAQLKNYHKTTKQQQKLVIYFGSVSFGRGRRGGAGGGGGSEGPGAGGDGPAGRT